MSDETVNAVEGPAETLPTEATVNAPEATPADEAIGALATPHEAINEVHGEATTDAETPVAAGTTEVAAEAPAAEASVAQVTPVAEPAPIVTAAPAVPKKAATSTRTNTAVATDPANDINIIRFDGEGLSKERGRRKVRVGKVVSNKMQKTVVVVVESRVRHPLYGKFMRRTTRFKAHDEQSCGEGDTVEIMETRPLSKDKNWRVVRIVEKAK